MNIFKKYYSNYVKKEMSKQEKISTIAILIGIIIIIIVIILAISKNNGSSNITAKTANLREYGYMDKMNNYIYYIAPNSDLTKMGIYKVKKDGSNKSEVKVFEENMDVLSLNCYKGYVYFIVQISGSSTSSDELDNKIYRMKKDGTALEVLNDNNFNDYCNSIYVNNNKIFYVGKDNHLYTMNLDGKNIKMLSDEVIVMNSDLNDYIVTDKYIIYNSNNSIKEDDEEEEDEITEVQGETLDASSPEVIEPDTNITEVLETDSTAPELLESDTNSTEVPETNGIATETLESDANSTEVLENAENESTEITQSSYEENEDNYDVTKIMSINGNNPKEILEHELLNNFDIDGNTIYYTNENHDLYKTKINSGKSELVYDGRDVYHLNIKNNYAYFYSHTDNNEVALYRVDLNHTDKGAQEVKILNTTTPCLNIIDNFIYYTDNTDTFSFSINLLNINDFNNTINLYNYNYENFYSNNDENKSSLEVDAE